jgi:predicted NUDIX family NTP pyrophosphohydrolase
MPTATMPKKSAGLLLYRQTSDESEFEVLLVHPGGPFWRNKDLGAWTIPKGEFNDDEDSLTAAKREFEEETGAPPPNGEFIPLKPVKQSSAKTVYVWAVKGDLDTAGVRSNTFQHEWPPKSGRMREFPEIDRAEWFTPANARQKILKGQAPLIDQLLSMLKTRTAV